MRKDAKLSDDGLYRYWLIRDWDATKPRVCFVMLNPSTADASEDDPTIRRCIGFAKSWGYGSLVVVNVCAFRATDPKNLLIMEDAVGPDNDNWIRSAVLNSDKVICAWGTFPHFTSQMKAVLKSIPMPYYLKLSKDGRPCHPLYLRSTLTPIPFNEASSPSSSD